MMFNKWGRIKITRIPVRDFAASFLDMMVQQKISYPCISSLSRAGEMSNKSNFMSLKKHARLAHFTEGSGLSNRGGEILRNPEECGQYGNFWPTKNGSQVPITQCHNRFGPYKVIRHTYASICAFTFAENCPWRLYAKCFFTTLYVTSAQPKYKVDVFSER